MKVIYEAGLAGGIYYVDRRWIYYVVPHSYKKYWKKDADDCKLLACELNRHARKSPNGRA